MHGSSVIKSDYEAVCEVAKSWDYMKNIREASVEEWIKNGLKIRDSNRLVTRIPEQTILHGAKCERMGG
jgi:hypothetical protein